MSNRSRSTGDARGHRHVRLEQLLHQEVQSLLRDEAADPALEGITVLAVHLSPDAEHARIAYAVAASLDQETIVRERAGEALDRAARFLRARLAHQLGLRKVPALGFTFVGVTTDGGDPCLE